METLENKIELLSTVKKKENLLGVWRLSYKLTNRMGPQGFTGRLISSYSDPLTGKDRHYYNESGVRQPGYFITRQTTVFEPRTNRQHAHIVDFLLGHPKVFVEREHADIDELYVTRKESNPRLMLVNLDYQEVDTIIEQDYIDKLIGQISLDKGPQAIGLNKLRFVLAKLNLKYRDDKYVKNVKVEKPKLRQRLKDFVRKGQSNADIVYAILDNLTNAQYEYEIKECIRMSILTNHGGVYRYKEVSLGLTIDSVISYFVNNVDLYGEISSELYKKLKKE